jgi:hypothetical protein
MPDFHIRTPRIMGHAYLFFLPRLLCRRKTQHPCGKRVRRDRDVKHYYAFCFAGARLCLELWAKMTVTSGRKAVVLTLVLPYRHRYVLPKPIALKCLLMPLT